MPAAMVSVQPVNVRNFEHGDVDPITGNCIISGFQIGIFSRLSSRCENEYLLFPSCSLSRALSFFSGGGGRSGGAYQSEKLGFISFSHRRKDLI